jgi:type VI secretion system secreted protein Hcp
MLKKLPKRLAAPLAAALITSAAVAAIALGGSSGTRATAVGAPPTPTGQVAGQLVIENGPAIPILSYSIGASNPTTIGSGGGGSGAGKVSFSSLNLMKNVDGSSAKLILDCAQGKHLSSASFTAQWGMGTASAKIVFDLEDVFVESVQQSGGGTTPSESLSLAYGKIRWTFTDANGTSTGGWDIVNNSGL